MYREWAEQRIPFAEIHNFCVARKLVVTGCRLYSVAKKKIYQRNQRYNFFFLHKMGEAESKIQITKCSQKQNEETQPRKGIEL